MPGLTSDSVVRVANATGWVERNRRQGLGGPWRPTWGITMGRWEVGKLDAELSYGNTATVSIWEPDLSADLGVNITGVRCDVLSSGESLAAGTVVFICQHWRGTWQVFSAQCPAA